MAGAAGAVHSRALSERRSRERSDFRAALAHRTQVHPLSMCIWLQSIKAKALLITTLLQPFRCASQDHRTRLAGSRSATTSLVLNLQRSLKHVSRTCVLHLGLLRRRQNTSLLCRVQHLTTLRGACGSYRFGGHAFGSPLSDGAWQSACLLTGRPAGTAGPPPHAGASCHVISFHVFDLMHFLTWPPASFVT